MKKIKILIVSNVWIGGVPKKEYKEFDTDEECNKWVTANLANFGGFPIVYHFIDENENNG